MQSLRSCAFDGIPICYIFGRVLFFRRERIIFPIISERKKWKVRLESKNGFSFQRWRDLNLSEMKTTLRPLISAWLVLLFLTAPVDGDTDDKACSYFFSRLIELPHKRLALSENGFESIWDGRQTAGCEVVFKSDETLVPGDRVFEVFQSLVTAPGWVINDQLTADGPGSSSVGIENAHSRCALHWSQHAWVDEKTGRIEQSSDIVVIVQCAAK